MRESENGEVENAERRGWRRTPLVTEIISVARGIARAWARERER